MESDLPFRKTPIPKKVEYVSRIWDFCKEFYNEKGEREECKNLFASFFKLHFQVLDQQDKRRNFRTPSQKLIYSCPLMPPNAQTGQNMMELCLLCGDEILYNDSSVECIKCSRNVHTKCASILYKFGDVENWRLDGVPETFCCKQVDLSFEPFNISELSNIKSKDKAKHLLGTARRIKKSRLFSNAFIECKFCNNSVNLEEDSHLLSCPAMGSPLTPAAKRIKLNEFDPENKKALFRMRKVGRFLKKVVDKEVIENKKKIAKLRDRCEAPVSSPPSSPVPPNLVDRGKE